MVIMGDRDDLAIKSPFSVKIIFFDRNDFIKILHACQASETTNNLREKSRGMSRSPGISYHEHLS
jgi:hypothetical protein